MKPLLLTSKCTGCGACVSKCKPGCIKLDYDESGYYKAFNFEDNCNGCGHCKIVCPALHVKGDLAQRIIAFQHTDHEVLSRSASGGAFSVLAEEVLEQGGIVYGVCVTDDCRAEYRSIEKKDDLNCLRNSKYIDVNVGKIGMKLKQDADTGRPILFVGLPCTIAGMKRLVKGRTNILWVDLLCFGKPSELAWKKWVAGLGRITQINFKDKRNGVSRWGISYRDESNQERFVARNKCPPLVDWLAQKNLSKQCIECPFHSFERPGDISLGDFWGIEKYVPTLTEARIQKGISMVLFNTSKGQEFLPLFDKGKIYEASQPYDFAKFNGGLSPLPRETNGVKRVRKVRTPSWVKQIGKRICFWRK